MSEARVPVQPEILDACKASEPDALRRRILDPNLPKNEAEHWASAEITRLTARIAELEKALGWFLSDDRFRVAVGGSPHVVEKMIAEARTTLEASERGGGK